MNNLYDVQTPITNIKLLKCPLENDNKNQLTFNNLTDQLSYFNTLPYLEMENCTYQRANGIIRAGSSIDDIIDYNYVMYQNANYSNKWFFAFIDRMEWANQNVTDIYISTDVFQTWQFDITYKPSFVEREHVNDDTIGLHTVPEGLELGDYIVQGVYKDSMESSDNVIVLASSVDPSLDSSGNLVGAENGGGVYGGIPTGYKLYTFDPGLSTITNVIKAFQKASKDDAILAIYMAPRIMIVPDLTIAIDNYAVPNTYRSTSRAFEISKPTALVNYVPKNKKLLTYPYVFLEVSNNNGCTVPFMYEYFSQNFADFIIDFVPSIGCNILLSPNSYKNAIPPCYDESIPGAKYPLGGWQNDPFTNWLTQNSVNIGLNLVKNEINTISGGILAVAGAKTGNDFLTLGGINQATNSYENILSTLGEVYSRSLVPPQASGNTNVGDVNYSLKNCSFTAYQKTIKPEFAKIIDDYMSMYGYKVNSLKVPNTTGRQNWNFVRTIGANILGDIPQRDLQEIKSIFDNGVTLWHNPATFLDYSQNNNIV